MKLFDKSGTIIKEAFEKRERKYGFKISWGRGTIKIVENCLKQLLKELLALPKKSPEEKKLKDKFKMDNFDLIAWFVVLD